MEGFEGVVKGYWKRGGYERLDRSRSRRRSRAELGGRRRWRIRIGRRLRFLRHVAASPRRILARIRDAYVRMMLGLANSRMCAASGGYGYGYGYGMESAAGFGRPQLKEYDEKMLIEIYKSIVAKGHAVAVGGGGEVALRR